MLTRRHVLAATAAALLCSFAAVAQEAVLRDPDVRVDRVHGFLEGTTARGPVLAAEPGRIHAAYLDRRFFVANEAFVTVSINEGGTWNSTDHRVDTTNPPGYPDGDAASVLVAASGDGEVYVMFTSADGMLAAPSVAVSHDRGETWPGPAIALSVLDDMPREGFGLVAAPGGRAAATWAGASTSSGERSIWMRRTADGGRTWLERQQVNRRDPAPPFPWPDPGEKSTEPVACADGAGHLYVAWKDRRHPTDPRIGAQQPGRILLRRSADGGATLEPADGEIRLDVGSADGTGNGADSRAPSLACAPGGLVAVAWEDDRAGDADIYVNVSTDHGLTWLAADVRIDGAPAGMPARRPRVALGGGDPPLVVVAWEDERRGIRDLFVTRSTDAGATWSAPQQVNAGAGDVPVSSPGWDAGASGTTVVVAWSDNRSGSATLTVRDVYSATSEDGGKTFAPPQRLDLASAPGAADSADVRLAVRGTAAVAIWSDTRAGAGADIWSGGAGRPFDARDADADGRPAPGDVCPDYPDPAQQDRDADGQGDPCDTFPADPANDGDLDGFDSPHDNCPFTANSTQDDTDRDGWGDPCDLCPGRVDALQRDLDGDRLGDACDPDVDGDGDPGASDPDDDGDGVADAPNQGGCAAPPPGSGDNCPCVPNALQHDGDGDGTGDACDDDDLEVSGVRLRGGPAPTPADWDREPTALGYDVLFGRVERLAAGEPGFCYAADLPFQAAHLVVEPAPGRALWFLVTAETAARTGSPGRASDGTPRPAAGPCTLDASRDWDGDGVPNVDDRCPFEAGQDDRDADGTPDACDAFPGDPDDDALDGDGVGADSDNCPFLANASQADADGDGRGDACDACPTAADPLGGDADRDGAADACDADIDGDGLANDLDPDRDGDGIADDLDLCPTTPDGRQADRDGDGTGDACDTRDGGEVKGVTAVPGQPPRLEWARTPGALRWSVYAGRAADLAPGAPYGSCRAGRTVPFLPLDDAIAPGEARWYLVTAHDAAGEGPAGDDSAGRPRSVPGGC